MYGWIDLQHTSQRARPKNSGHFLHFADPPGENVLTPHGTHSASPHWFVLYSSPGIQRTQLDFLVCPRLL